MKLKLLAASLVLPGLIVLTSGTASAEQFFGFRGAKNYKNNGKHVCRLASIPTVAQQPAA
jgi:hypothetical protein